MSLIHHPDARRHLEALHERAPYDPEVTRAMLHLQHGNFGANAPVEALEQAYAPVLDFSVPQIAQMARLVTNNPAAYERFMARAAAQKGLYYFSLGDYFAARDDAQKAAGYYEKGVQTCSDEVAVSNNCRWLVSYYFHHGRPAEAEQLADRVAEAYSFMGLKTKGDLLYWQGKYDASLDVYRQIEERYDRPGVITEWWADYRGSTNDARYDGEVEKRLKALFPRGVEKVTLDSFPKRPDEGVLIDGENELTRAAGLKKGDLIVALDGRRVYDLPQSIYVRLHLKDPALRLIVWHGRGFREVSASPPNHRFGVSFQPYSRLR
jgi:tetratricopeptide (TPR) repeat protein